MAGVHVTNPGLVFAALFQDTPQVPNKEQSMDPHTLAYAACTSFAELHALDRVKGVRANNKVRLAKMEQLQIAQELEAIQKELACATQKLNDLLQSQAIT